VRERTEGEERVGNGQGGKRGGEGREEREGKKHPRPGLGK